LVLQNNLLDNLTVSTNGNFSFATSVSSGSTYSVTVLTQPSNPTQNCIATNGSGTVGNGNVTNVQIVCTVVTFTIGGAVSGLSGGGLTLQDNGGDALSVSANGSFTFATAIASGGSYSVTVLTQPSNPTQNCAVASGSGTVGNANVTNVAVDCGNSASAHNLWTWVGGSNMVNQLGIYGSQGVPAPGNVPGARYCPAVWTGTDGSLWLFGGSSFNDLWRYSSGQWTWIGGSNVANQQGIYGTQGTPSSNNNPGARVCSVTWTDPAGDFWLFGGSGLDSTGASGELNDLWKYSSGQWTWVSGSNLVNQPGVYGTQGVPDSANVPGSRFNSITWVDSAGDLWLFGGAGLDSTDVNGKLNDLWKYSGGKWTWVGGPNIVNQAGVYGTQGTGAKVNMPGARDHGVGFTDALGDFWLLGGGGFDSTGTSGYLNDLWKYTAGQWTWVSGSDLVNQPGVYGTQGVSDSGNVPGGRSGSSGWGDKAGNLWLFGGSNGAMVDFNDLWKYSGGQWTWVKGPNTTNQQGVYGTQGTPAPGNVPGARLDSGAWIDKSGNLWLFGGVPVSASINDLWEYTP
jgi:hypothetical protein